jgi:hypothetical protein
MNQIEVMKQALEALDYEATSHEDDSIWKDEREALRQAIEQAEQINHPCGDKCKHGDWCTESYCQEKCEFTNVPLPTAPVQQEPVAWRWSEVGSTGIEHWFDWTTDWENFERAKSLGCKIEYAAPTAPAQQPLTDEQIQAVLTKTFSDNEIQPDDLALIRAIEAAHGITGEKK